MNIEITEKEILNTPNDQESGVLVRKKYFELLKVKN